MSSKAHEAIDRVYDQLSEERAEIESEQQDDESTEASSIHGSTTITSSFTSTLTANVITPAANPGITKPPKPAIILGLPDALLVQIVTFIENPIFLSMSCRSFWNVVSAMTSFRVFHQILCVDRERAMETNSNRISTLIKAFGIRDLRIKVDLISRNLEFALNGSV